MTAPEFNYYPLNIQLLEGTTTGNIISAGAGSVMAAGYLQSPNFVVGSSGWKIGADGNVEFDSGTFRGTITASTGTIGGWSINATSLYTGTEDHSGYTANAGDITIYSDGTNASIHAYNFYIDADGKFYSKSGALSGVSITTVPNDTATDISLLEKTWTMTFSVTDADTIAWSSGTITFSNGRTFSISAGNTGNMAAMTYVYLDPATSTTVLQTTTTATTALAANKSLIGTAQNNTVTASWIPYGPGQPLVDGANIGALSITASQIAATTITAAKIAANTITAAQIAVGTITATELAADSVTATKIDVANLAAISADMGTITAGTVTGATIRTASSGTRFTMDSTSFQGINSVGTVIFEVILTGADEGDVILGDDALPTYAKWDNSEGILFVNGYALASDVEYGVGSKVIIEANTERYTALDTYTKLKDIEVVRNGTMTVDFDAMTEGQGKARVYVDGVASGTERTVTGTYATYSQSIEVEKGKSVQVYAKSDVSAMDYDDFTESDANGRIAKTTDTKATVTGLRRNDSDHYLYKDFTDNFFSGNFIFREKINLSSADNGGVIVTWMLANDVDDLGGLNTANKSFLAFQMYRDNGGNYILAAFEQDSSDSYTDTYTCSVATDYYVKISRDESVGTYGTLYAYIYSDSTYETLLDTLTLTLHTSKKDFRYYYWVSAGITDANQAASGTIEQDEIATYIKNFKLKANAYETSQVITD